MEKTHGFSVLTDLEKMIGFKNASGLEKSVLRAYLELPIPTKTRFLFPVEFSSSMRVHLGISRH